MKWLWAIWLWAFGFAFCKPTTAYQSFQLRVYGLVDQAIVSLKLQGDSVFVNRSKAKKEGEKKTHSQVVGVPASIMGDAFFDSVQVLLDLAKRGYPERKPGCDEVKDTEIIWVIVDGENYVFDQSSNQSCLDFEELNRLQRIQRLTKGLIESADAGLQKIRAKK